MSLTVLRFASFVIAALHIVGCALPPGPAAMDVAEAPDGGATVESSAAAPTDLQSARVFTDEPPSTETPIADAMSNDGPAVFTAADPLPLPDLEGRIVWVEPREDERGRSGDVHSLDLSSGTHELLWSDTLDVRHWAVAPETGMAAYRTMRDDGEVLVARALTRGAEPVVVATTPTSATRIASPVWGTDGREIGYTLDGATCLSGLPGTCEFRIVDGAGVVDSAIWSGSVSEFPFACDCGNAEWSPDMASVALFEHPFEWTFSKQLSVVGRAGGQAIDRYEVETEIRARAHSTDGRRIVLLDSASYYGSRLPLSSFIFASPDQWPGRASVRVVDIETREIVDVAAWDTDVGFTHPIWSPDGAWFAFAEPVGSFPTPTPLPTSTAFPAAPIGYPPPSRALSTSERGAFIQSETIVWVLTADGIETGRFDMPNIDTWPVAASPSGEHLLIATYMLEEGSVDLSVSRISDGAGVLLATVPNAAAEFFWIR